MELSTEQKKAYIEAMDIDSWYPRMILPNSLEPILIQAGNESAAPFEAIVDADARSHVPEPPKESSQVSGGQSAPSEQIKEPPINPSDAPIKFGISLYVLDQWLVVSSLTSDYHQYNDSAIQLIRNIANAIPTRGAKGESTLHYHHVISWPFFTNPNASQGINAAKQYVNGVIEHLLEEHKVSGLLVFGGVLPKLNGWKDIEGTNFGLNRIILPSLYRMLNEPNEKRKAWSVIKSSSYVSR